MRRTLLAAVGVLLAILTGVYLAGRTVVEHRADAALEQLRGELPAGVSLTVERVAVALDLHGVTLHGLRLKTASATLRGERVAVRGGVWPFAAAGGRIRRITVHAPRGRLDSRTTIRADRLRLGDVTLGGTGILYAGQGRIAGLTATGAGTQLRVPTVYLEDVAPPRVDRVYANTSTLHTGGSIDTSVRLTGLSLRDVDLGPMLPAAGREHRAVPVAGDGRLATVSTGRIDVVARGQSRRTVRRLRIGLRRRADGAVTGRVRFAGAANDAGRPRSVGDELSARLTAIIAPRDRRAVLRDLDVDLPGGTRITGRARLDVARARGGPTASPVDPSRLRLVDLNLNVQGNGAVAAWLGADRTPARAAVRGLLATELASLSRFAQAAEARARRSAHALRRFLRDGGRIQVTAMPREPVPVERLRALARKRPMDLIGATGAAIRRP